MRDGARRDPDAARRAISAILTFASAYETPSTSMFLTWLRQKTLSIHRGKEMSCTVTTWKRNVQLASSMKTMR